MSKKNTDKGAIVRFVREELGCACPDEVFESISIRNYVAEPGDVLKGKLLEIGGRLLVYLVKTEDVTSVVSHMEQIFRRGRELRNAGGFNRFRLVVAVPVVQPAEELLSQEFDSLTGLDKKLHLHVISNDQLPRNSAGKSFL